MVFGALRHTVQHLYEPVSEVIRKFRLRCYQYADDTYFYQRLPPNPRKAVEGFGYDFGGGEGVDESE